jgi:hypothetical protein
MMQLVRYSGLIFSFFFWTNCYSDSFQPSHGCYKPHKPYKFNSQQEVDRFNDDVERYKVCISDFVEEQNREASKHYKAAEEAIDEWNRYARFELN